MQSPVTPFLGLGFVCGLSHHGQCSWDGLRVSVRERQLWGLHLAGNTEGTLLGSPRGAGRMRDLGVVLLFPPAQFRDTEERAGVHLRHGGLAVHQLWAGPQQEDPQPAEGSGSRDGVG